MAKPEAILGELASSAHEKVKVAVTDVDGILRGKYLQKDKFLSAAENGFGFCNVVFGWDANDVKDYLSAYYQNFNSKTMLTYLRIPGTFEYWDNLDKNLSATMAGHAGGTGR